MIDSNYKPTSIGATIYEELVNEYNKTINDRVTSGELSEDEADFLEWLSQDDILDAMPDEWFEEHSI